MPPENFYDERSVEYFVPKGEFFRNEYNSLRLTFPLYVDSTSWSKSSSFRSLQRSLYSTVPKIVSYNFKKSSMLKIPRFTDRCTLPTKFPPRYRILRDQVRKRYHLVSPQARHFRTSSTRDKPLLRYTSPTIHRVSNARKCFDT